MNLPPDPIPPMTDPALDDELSIYHYSRLRMVTGQRINPHAVEVYKRRSAALGPGTPVTAAHPQLELHLANVMGFDPRMRLEQPTTKDWPLPRVISRVHPSNQFPSWELPEGGAYAVDYARVNPGLKTMPTSDWVYDFKDRLPKNSFTILDFIGKHHYVTNLWSQGPQWWQQPFLESFDAVIIPEFSAFLDDPRPQYLIGERQKQIFAQEGWESGKLVIPSIAWSSEASLRRQLDLLGSMYPKINTICLDALGKGVDPVQWRWSRLLMLEKHAKDLPFRFLIAGASATSAIAELNYIFPRGNYHLLDIGPYFEAVKAMGNRLDRGRVYREKIARRERMMTGEDPVQRRDRPEIDPALRDTHE